MAKKHAVRLQLSLRQLFARSPMSEGDSLCIVPLRDEYTEDITVYGKNNILPELKEKPLKIIL